MFRISLYLKQPWRAYVACSNNSVLAPQNNLSLIEFCYKGLVETVHFKHKSLACSCGFRFFKCSCSEFTLLFQVSCMASECLKWILCHRLGNYLPFKIKFWNLFFCGWSKYLVLYSTSAIMALVWQMYGPEPSPESFQQGPLRLFRGAWHSEIWEKLHRFIVLHNSIWGLGALFGLTFWNLRKTPPICSAP